MADRNSGTEEDTGVRPGRGTASRRTRWRFGVGICIAIALVVLMVLLHLTGVLGPGVH